MRELTFEECGLVAGAEGEPGNDAAHKAQAEAAASAANGGTYSCTYAGPGQWGAGKWECVRVSDNQLEVNP